jgi:hypothetical protein
MIHYLLYLMTLVINLIIVKTRFQEEASDIS